MDLRGSFDGARPPGGALSGRRSIYLPQARSYVDVPVYARYLLAEGTVVDGPAVIEEDEATTVLWPADRAAVDAMRNLVVHIDGRTGTAAPGGEAESRAGGSPRGADA